MSKLPVPDFMLDTIYDLTPEQFQKMGKSMLLLDLDNTMSPYHLHKPTPALVDWIDRFKQAGIALFILSNNKGERPAVFAKALGIDYVNRAKKPNTEVLEQVLRERKLDRNAVALMGDQIYTDTLCAKRANITAIVVKPICITRNPLLALRYWAEFPFRLTYRIREKVRKSAGPGLNHPQKGEKF